MRRFHVIKFYEANLYAYQKFVDINNTVEKLTLDRAKDYEDYYNF